MVASSSTRTSEATAPHVNEQIQQRMRQNIEYFAHNPGQIGRRLAELDREWDIERVLQANAAALSALGAWRGLFRNRLWFILPGVVGGFLLQHAIQGWCPPVELFRRWGFRTPREIEEERFALKALRGDLKDIAPNAEGEHDVDRTLTAVQS